MSLEYRKDQVLFFHRSKIISRNTILNGKITKLVHSHLCKVIYEKSWFWLIFLWILYVLSGFCGFHSCLCISFVIAVPVIIIVTAVWICKTAATCITVTFTLIMLGRRFRCIFLSRILLSTFSSRIGNRCSFGFWFNCFFRGCCNLAYYPSSLGLFRGSLVSGWIRFTRYSFLSCGILHCLWFLSWSWCPVLNNSHYKSP